jgi:hypothetical protein
MLNEGEKYEKEPPRPIGAETDEPHSVHGPGDEEQCLCRVSLRSTGR